MDLVAHEVEEPSEFAADSMKAMVAHSIHSNMAWYRRPEEFAQLKNAAKVKLNSDQKQRMVM